MRKTADALFETGVMDVVVVTPFGPAVEGNPPRNPFRWFVVFPWFSPRLVRRMLSPGRLRRERILHRFETASCIFFTIFLRALYRFDVIHFLSGNHFLIELFAWVNPRIKVVLNVTGLSKMDFQPGFLGKRKEELDRIISDRVRKRKQVVVIGETDETAKSWSFLSAENRVVSYGIVDTALIDKIAARQVLNISKSGILGLLFGGHRADKDYKTVFEAVSSLHDRPIHLVFVGELVSDNNPEVIAKEYPCASATFVNRFIGEREVALFFAACDFVILPYKPSYAKGSGVIFEAIRFARPVVVSETPFFKKLLAEYRIGLLYTPGSSSDLARKIRNIIAFLNDESDSYMADRARVLNSYNMANIAQQYVSIYRGLSE